ncbi:hypothetical protein E2C01_082802 [Portunus trituberculatus]|uniref:Uncharacterized protein n=1 Tax=Portunus trituberculatus TaxID=210409 RepID=A0A5B7ITA3_PORTR|nr:hypothetical protein [Portunus trituberculatus]
MNNVVFIYLLIHLHCVLFNNVSFPHSILIFLTLIKFLSVWLLYCIFFFLPLSTFASFQSPLPFFFFPFTFTKSQLNHINFLLLFCIIKLHIFLHSSSLSIILCHSSPAYTSSTTTTKDTGYEARQIPTSKSPSHHHHHLLSAPPGPSSRPDLSFLASTQPHSSARWSVGLSLNDLPGMVTWQPYASPYTGYTGQGQCQVIRRKRERQGGSHLGMAYYSEIFTGL